MQAQSVHQSEQLAVSESMDFSAFNHPASPDGAEEPDIEIVAHERNSVFQKEESKSLVG